MSPVFVTRRRAEEFDAALAARSTEAAGEGRYDDLLALVGALRAVPQPEPRADFVADLRSRLLAEAATLPAPDPADAEADRLRLRPADPGRPRRPRERRVSLALGGLALVGATATLSVVAQSALPGDTLYPLKRGIESAHAGLSVSEGGKGSTLLSSASTRLDEVSQLDPQQQPTEIADTLDDFTEQASQASDLLLGQYEEDGDQANVTKVRTFAESSMKSLADLGGTLPPEAQDEWVHAVTTLVRIDDEAALTCPTCAGTDLDAVTPDLPTVGTGFGTGILPAVNLPYLGPGLVLPSVDATGLPPGSVTKPSPTAGPGAGPTGQPTGGPDRRAHLGAAYGRAHRRTHLGLADGCAADLRPRDRAAVGRRLGGHRHPDLGPVAPDPAAVGRCDPAPRRRGQRPPDGRHLTARRPSPLTAPSVVEPASAGERCRDPVTAVVPDVWARSGAENGPERQGLAETAATTAGQRQTDSRCISRV